MGVLSRPMPSSFDPVNQPEIIAPVPIRSTLGAAMRLVAAEWLNLLKILLLPCVLFGLLELLIPTAPAVMPAAMVANSAAVSDNWLHDNTPHLLFALLNVLLQCWLAVAVYRYVILGENSPNWLPVYHPQVWHYLGRMLLGGLIFFAPVGIAALILFMLLPTFVAVLMTMFALLGMSVIAVRISLSFPATAVGGDYTFRASWRRTRGQALRIMMVNFLTSLVMFLPLVASVIVVAVIGWAAPPLAKVLSFVFTTIVQVTTTYVVSALLYAHFYQDKSVVTTAEAPHVL